MNIIINHSSMQPIYEQIMGQIKDSILLFLLNEDTALPSVRTFAKELKVSALTVKKAYDGLEEEGFIVTVHGKGSFVACAYATYTVSLVCNSLIASSLLIPIVFILSVSFLL